MSHHFIERVFILIARYIFCGEKVFSRSEIPGGGAEAGAGNTTTTTTRRCDKHSSQAGAGGEVSPPEYADTNVKFVPKINRELKSG